MGQTSKRRLKPTVGSRGSGGGGGQQENGAEPQQLTLHHVDELTGPCWLPASCIPLGTVLAAGEDVGQSQAQARAPVLRLAGGFYKFSNCVWCRNYLLGIQAPVCTGPSSP